MTAKTRPNAAPWPDRPLFIVDDDTQWIEVLTQALHAAGWHRVRALADPSYAVQLAAEFRPAVVLLDLRMAEKDGASVLEELRKDQPELPVIMVTGVDHADAAVHCLQLGATDYLTKPLTRERLDEALRGAVLDEGTDDEAGLSFRDALQQLDELPNLKQVPDMLIEEALRRSGGVVKDAAAMLGISAQAICNRRRRASAPA